MTRRRSYWKRKNECELKDIKELWKKYVGNIIRNIARLGKGCEIGEVFEKETPGFGCGTNNLKASQTQIGQVAAEHFAAPQEATQLQCLISSKCGAQRKLLWLSFQRKPNCTA